MAYNTKLSKDGFRPRAPQPGSRRAVPSETLVEPKWAAVRAADRWAGGPVRDSLWNSGWRWRVQLLAGLLGIVEGIGIIAIAAGVFGRMV